MCSTAAASVITVHVSVDSGLCEDGMFSIPASLVLFWLFS